MLLTVEEGIARIVLNRPAVANAFDQPMADALLEAVAACGSADVRVVVLTGAGPRFCGGGDVSTFQSADNPSEYLFALATTLEEAVRLLAEMPKPVIAAVHGAVAGAGLGLVLAADIVVAARGTKFATAYAGIGLTPDCGVSFLLPRVIGLRRALEISLLGRVIRAEEAVEWGLASMLASDAMHAAADIERIAETLASGPAPAFGQARRLLRAGSERSRSEHGEDEARTISAAVRTPDAQRLIQHFLDR
ncbi:enoyl-CoA hydratase/isomerase family protein [Microbacterium sp. LMI11-1-1.1]